MGFTGAGLYTSAKGCLNVAPGKKPKTPAWALGQAWGSLWNDRAFAERDHYGIPHDRVALGVLVHRNFPDEDSNGVILTRSLVDAVHHVSVQPLDDAVTNPTGGRTGDEIQAVFSGNSQSVPNGANSQNNARIVAATYANSQTPVLTKAGCKRGAN